MDPIFVQFVQDHSDVVAVEYHAWWPGASDPFYQHNIAENTARINYYNVNATPWLWVDGIIEPTWVYTYDRINTAYNTRKNTPTSVSFSFGGLYDEISGDVNITVTASTDQALPGGDYRIHAVLIENELEWNAPNGIDVFHYIMRDMYPDAGGTPVAFAGDFPQTADATASFNATQYADEHCEIVFFLQNFGSKEVYQAGSVTLAELADPSSVDSAPAMARLGQNYPNPFNPSTVIPVTMDRAEALRLTVLDARGRVVRRLHEGFMDAGLHEFTWDGRDESGAPVSSGLYLAQLAGSQGIEAKRLLLLK